MEDVQIDLSMDVDAKINEAKVCHEMGLLDESLEVYQKVIPLIPEEDAHLLEKVKTQIGTLQKEIEERENTAPQSVSAEDLSIFKEALYIPENIPAITDSATAFKDMGLYNEAVLEYEKLLFLDHPYDKIIPEMTECLLKTKSLNKIVAHFELTIKDERLKQEDKANIQLYLGLEMEKRDHKDIAVDLYKVALALNPNSKEINQRIEFINQSMTPRSKYDYLLKNEIVSNEQLQKAYALSKKLNKSVEYVLVEHIHIRKEEIGKSFREYYAVPFKVHDPNIQTPFELLQNLKKPFLINAGWVPISWGKEGVEIIVDDPKDLNKTDNIKTLMKTQKIVFHVAIKEDIEEYIKRFFDDDTQSERVTVEGEFDDIDIPDISFEEEEDEDEYDDETVDGSSSKVVKLVDQCIIAAYRKGASDIHVEPSPVTKATTVRFRIDGVCQDYIKVPNSMARGIISRIKIMASLDIAEKRLPQDGKIKFKRKGVPVFELRLATIPTAGGFEDAVLRILAKAGAMPLDQMDMSERNLEVLTQVIARPYGLILCVGPTGSGKTTTLHAALGTINKPEIKIWTAEDPIEITQAGLRQVEARPKIGLNFARVMRSFLRADPDVIMIGEMRDEETAKIGIEASLTGHLVFSTLHTNSAPETITRLLDMGLNPLNFSDAFLGVLAQRLVRRLCTECRAEYNPTEAEFEDIVKEYGEQHFQKTGIVYSPDLKFYKTDQCEFCSGSGYKGRVGIHELMNGTPEIKLMIKKAAGTEEIAEIAIEQGMTTLKQDGIVKVFNGTTDIKDVWRVCIN